MQVVLSEFVSNNGNFHLVTTSRMRWCIDFVHFTIKNTCGITIHGWI